MSSRGRASLAGLAVTVLFCLPLLPEILGTRRLVFRDAQVTHWPWRRVAMESLAAGRVPFVNVSASGGEPLLANPNAVLLYPTLLLERVFAPAAAFNLHYLLHVLWAFFGARALARRLGLPGGPAFFAAVAFAFSGIMMSYGSAFANSAAAASWLPWCAAATLDLVRARGGGRTLRAGATAAIGFGLQLLAGEPSLSLLTILFAAFLGTAEILSTKQDRPVASANLLAGGALAGLVAAALASPLLLPLLEVLPLTYRGQHLYSARAFGASPFAVWRMVEWFFPRFDGDPGALAAGAHWQFAFHREEIVYIWCVTLGVIPLVAVLIAAARRGFWTRRTVWLAAGALVSLLFAFGFSLPFFRILFTVPALRRLRYPIKFYLLTTLCVSLLAGFAGERLRPQASRAGRREGAILLAVALLFGAALLVSWEAKTFDRAVAPLLSGLALPPSELLPEIRRSLTGDAFFGLLAAAVLALVLFSRWPIRGRCHLLALATLLLAFPWSLPLFVSADEKDLARAPVVTGVLRGPGRVHIAPRLAESGDLSTRGAHPALPPRVVKLARAQIEELVPLTGAAFGLRYLFETDPDGSYGYYNRLASEAFAASDPGQASRLLRAYGARWVLNDQGAGVLPFFRPVTGFEVAGRRLLLSEIPEPVAELRWAGREFRRSSLSGALDLVRSERLLPESDVVLPGRSDQGPQAPEGRAALSSMRVEEDAAWTDVAAETPGHVVFSRTYFPAWKARLDGRPVPVLVANARDLAVAVPAGNHHVDFEYDRAPFQRGVTLQATGFLLIVLVGLRRR
jgi:hypothetical protein